MSDRRDATRFAAWGRRCLAAFALLVGPSLGAVSTLAGQAVGNSAVASSKASTLVEAARGAEWDTVRDLVRAGGDVNVRSADGTTALHWASYWSDRESVDLLIAAGADPSAANDLGATPLWSATLTGNAPLVKALLDAGADPNVALLAGETPLMTAARTGATEAVRALLDHGADPDAKGTRAQTALMWAAAEGHTEVVRALVTGGADLHARSDVWTQLWQNDPAELVHPDLRQLIEHGGYTALLFAARDGRLGAAEALLDGGANPSDASAYGTSATVLAAHSGNTDLVRLLLDRGADPDAAEAGYAALHAALLRRHPEMVRILLEHGADPNAVLRTPTPVRRASNDYYFNTAFVGATAFWLAARFWQPESMRYLAEAGADPLFALSTEYWTGRITMEGGWVQASEGPTTALMAAVGMGARGRGSRGFEPPPPEEGPAETLEAVKLAIELGVDVNAVDQDGTTALETAMALGPEYAPVVFLLEAHGATLPDAR